jgi:hypothetical protein
MGSLDVKARDYFDRRGGVMDDHRGRGAGDGSRDGTVGHWVDAKLRAGLAAQGNHNWDNKQLVDHHGHLTADGVAAVREFQDKQGIKIDGIVGRQTFGKLNHPTGPTDGPTHDADTAANSAYDHHFPTWNGDHYEGGEPGKFKASLGHIVDDIINKRTDLPEPLRAKLEPTARALQTELDQHRGGLTRHAVELFEKMGRDSGFTYGGRPVTGVNTLGPGFNQLVLHFSLYHKFE